MKVSAIVLAAGRSLRFSRSKISKVLTPINSKPIIIYSLEILSKHPSVRDIIVVVNEQNLKGITNQISDSRIRKIRRIVKGGIRRQDSVINALSVLNRDIDFVLIHDAARPFINRNMVSSLIKEAARYGAAIAGVPVKATVKEVDLVRSSEFAVPSKSKNRKERGAVTVKRTLDRSRLWEIQTPQVFKKDLIVKAYKKFGRLDVTDDAMLVEKLGEKVRVVLGSYDNIKITTPEDLVVAEAILKSKK
jgi:2-C-methyl-D-erythritol 4-phosphate cytidylyltransferase